MGGHDTADLLAIDADRKLGVAFPGVLGERQVEHARPAAGTARMNTFEADIVTIYTFPELRLGNLCEGAGLTDQARVWYQRALAINPQFSQAREALTRLEH